MKAVCRVVVVVLALVVCAWENSALAQVSASLVAADKSARPGHELTVAVRLVHDPKWHTYWANPGTGLPTRLAWTLPEGWVAGPINWPTPHLIKDESGHITGYGYAGETWLPVTLKIPAHAKDGPVDLRAEVRWLMCERVCIPGRQDIALIIPVSQDSPIREAQVQEALAAQSMPGVASDWQVSASHDGKSVSLRLDGPPQLINPYFFSEDGFIAFDQPQVVSSSGSQIRMQLPIADDADPTTSQLVGVLAYSDAKGEYNGIKIIQNFASRSATARAMEGATSSGSAHPSLLLTLALAVLGGLVLNLMPCVFPVLGIKVMGLVQEAGSDSRQVSWHGLIFTFGVLVSFWTLAAILAAVRSGGTMLGWGFQLQSPGFVFALASLLLIFALNLSGMFEFGLRATTIGGTLLAGNGRLGTFFSGVLATLLATPCSAPFLAPALGAALVLPFVQSIYVFTAIGLGLSLPYLLLALFPRALRWMPKPGRWMETFKQSMAFPLFATVAYLVWVLAGQIDEDAFLMLLLGLVVIAMAVWCYGRYVRPTDAIRGQLVPHIVAVVILSMGLILGWPRAQSPGDIVWEPWSVQRVAELRGERRSIYVDFTARWCATCQANKKLVFGSEAVTRYVRDHRIALLKADWTNSDPEITAELRRWNRSAVPFNLVYGPNTEKPVVLPEILTPSVVLETFRASSTDRGS